MAVAIFVSGLLVGALVAGVLAAAVMGVRDLAHIAELEEAAGLTPGRGGVFERRRVALGVVAVGSGRLLASPQWRDRADVWIADKCGVSDTFVGKVRAEHITVIGSTGDPVLDAYVDGRRGRLGRDGKVRKMPRRTGKPDEDLDDLDEAVTAIGRAVR